MSTKNGTNKQTCLVKCRVEPGMFKSEWLATIDAVDPGGSKSPVHVELFVDQTQVTSIDGTPARKRPARGWLRVSLVRAKGELVQVVLPQPSTAVGETVVMKKELVDFEDRV